MVLSLVWIPTGFGLVALSWDASIIGVPGDWLDRAVLAVQVVAVATLILGAVGAMLHDEIEEIVVYSIVQDAGFILLALTARSDDAASPARLWLLVFVIAKSALVAWAAAVSWAFESSSLGDLRGWLRRSPILGLALVAIVAATLGWPGSPVFEARDTLVSLGLPGSLHFLGTAAMLLSLAYYARLLAIGLMTPTATVRRAEGDWLHWPHLPKFADETAEAASQPAAEAAAAAVGEAVRAPLRPPPTRTTGFRLAIPVSPLAIGWLSRGGSTDRSRRAFSCWRRRRSPPWSPAVGSGLRTPPNRASRWTRPPRPGPTRAGSKSDHSPPRSRRRSLRRGATLPLATSPSPVASPAPSASASLSPAATTGD